MQINNIRNIVVCLIVIVCTAGDVRGSDTLRLSLKEGNIVSSVNSLDIKWSVSTQSGQEFANPDFDDRSFPEIHSNISEEQSKKLNPDFKPVWYRVRVQADADVAGTPLAIKFVARGYTAVYFDGKLIKRFPEGTGGDFWHHLNPVFIDLPDTAIHLLAIQFGQHDMEKDFGFLLELHEANHLVTWTISRIGLLGLTMLTVGGVYFSMFLLHLLMFLFNRAERSNVFFALFSLSAAVIFILIYTAVTGQLKWSFFTGPVCHSS